MQNESGNQQAAEVAVRKHADVFMRIAKTRLSEAVGEERRAQFAAELLRVFYIAPEMLISYLQDHTPKSSAAGPVGFSAKEFLPLVKQAAEWFVNSQYSHITDAEYRAGMLTGFVASIMAAPRDPYGNAAYAAAGKRLYRESSECEALKTTNPVACEDVSRVREAALTAVGKYLLTQPAGRRSAELHAAYVGAFLHGINNSKRLGSLQASISAEKLASEDSCEMRKVATVLRPLLTEYIDSLTKRGPAAHRGYLLPTARTGYIAGATFALQQGEGFRRCVEAANTLSSDITAMSFTLYEHFEAITGE